MKTVIKMVDKVLQEIHLSILSRLEDKAEPNQFQLIIQDHTNLQPRRMVIKVAENYILSELVE